jgi:HSP20 family protein
MSKIFDEPLAARMPAPFMDYLERPAVNIKESNQDYVLEAELPGMKKENVQIEFLDNNTLQIKGSRELKNEEGSEQDYTWKLMESGNESFARSFSFPSHIIPDKIEAVYRDGILKIKIPKEEPRNSIRSIQVK